MINPKNKVFEKAGFFPHNGQKEVLQCDNKEVVICAGRRWGKSALVGAIATYWFLKLVNEVKKGKRQSVKIWIVAPTYRLTEKVFEYIIKFVLAIDKRFDKFISGGGVRPYQIKVSESIWIECKSATEPYSMLGEELDIVIIDEAPLIPKKIYEQYIYPLTIAKSRDSKTYLIGTPRGKNWFQKLYLRLKQKNAAFHFTTLDGVETDEEKLEEIKQNTPDLLFRQEYLAEFLDEAGTVFKNLDDIIGNYEFPQEPVSNRFYIMGVDLGRMDDNTVITIIDSFTHDVVHIDKFSNLEYPIQKDHIIAKAKHYNNARVYIDATGVGKPIYEDLGRAGVFVEDFTFSGKAKEELIGKLIVFAENKYIRIPNLDFFVDELKAFEYLYINEKTGERLRNTRYAAPKGFHDDCVDSLALAVWGLYMEKPQSQSPTKNALQKALEPVKRRRYRSFI